MLLPLIAALGLGLVVGFAIGLFSFHVLVVHELRQLHGKVWVFLRGLELRGGRGERVRDVLVRAEVIRMRRRRPG